ncbi:tetratricopeptide repeat protein [Candidatus Latescibacterota bacterium]
MKRGVIFAVLVLIIFSTVFAQEQVTVNPESGAAYKLGLTFYEREMYDRAIQRFVRAYELDNRNTSALLAHGLTLGKTGKHSEAAVLYEKVLTVEPGNMKAYKALVGAYSKADEKENAIGACDRGMGAASDDPFFPVTKARLLITLDRDEEALASLLIAHELAPADVETMEDLARTYVRLGRMEEAQQTARRILEHDPDNAEAHIILGDYLRMTGKQKEAVEEYKAAAEDIEAKAYAEHQIESIEQEIEEQEIEDEYEESQGKQSEQSSGTAPQSKPKKKGLFEKKPQKKAAAKTTIVKTQTQKKSGILLLVVMMGIVMAIVSIHAIYTYRKR